MTLGRQLVNEALEAAGGDRDKAAAALNLSLSTVNNTIAKSPELMARWGAGFQQPPVQVNTLHRPPDALPHINGDEADLVKSMVREDSLLADGLNKLGLTPEESALAVQLAGFHQNCFVQSVQISGSGMTRIGIKLSTQIDEIAKRLEAVRAKLNDTSSAMTLTRKVLMDEEKYLLSAYIAMTDQIRRISDTAMRGMMLTAAIRYKIGRRNDKPLPTKPGYSTGFPQEMK